MLLKIYTSSNTVKIIDKLDDVEVHTGSRSVKTWAEMYDLTTPPIRGTFDTPKVDNYDWVQGCRNERVASANDFIHPALQDVESAAAAYPVQIKLVDYLRAGEWKRVAIQQYAYLCNDDGKTIQKID